MNAKLFVGNVSYTVTENDLQVAFSEFGEVSYVNLILDHATGKSRGFGFVTMANAHGVRKVIEQLNGKQLAGRRLAVNEAKPKAQRVIPKRHWNLPVP